MFKNVIVVGEPPLAEALAARVRANQGEAIVYSVEGNDMAWTEALAAASDASLAVELIDTDLSHKHAIISALDEALPPTVPLLTSILAVTGAEVAAWLRHPRRVVGVSLLPPFLEQTVVEVAALPGAEVAGDAARRFLAGVGLSVADIQDSVGGVAPRIIACLANEAAFAVGEGVASEADINQAMRLGVSYPRGPLAWARAIGLRRVVAILDGLHRETPDGRYRVAPWLRRQARSMIED